MSLDYEAVYSAALQLPVSDQLRLIDELASKVPDDAPSTLSEEWLAELDRRTAEIDSGAEKPVPWSEVRRALMDEIGHDRAG